MSARAPSLAGDPPIRLVLWDRLTAGRGEMRERAVAFVAALVDAMTEREYERLCRRVNPSRTITFGQLADAVNFGKFRMRAPKMKWDPKLWAKPRRPSR